MRTTGKRPLEVENDPPEGNLYLGLFLVIFTYWKYNLYPLAHRFDRAWADFNLKVEKRKIAFYYLTFMVEIRILKWHFLPLLVVCLMQYKPYLVRKIGLFRPRVRPTRACEDGQPEFRNVFWNPVRLIFIVILEISDKNPKHKTRYIFKWNSKVMAELPLTP